MSGETESDVSGWTVDTLKQWVDMRFRDMQEAVLKAENASNDRFASVNEFRQTLTDLSRTFIPRAEYEQRVRAMDATIIRLEKEAALRAGSESKGQNLGRASLSIIAIVISLLGVASSLIAVLTRH